MKLDRNINATGIGKYALINLRKNTVEWGSVGSDDEFFVFKLKDVYAPAALEAYAAAAEPFDPEWAAEVRELASRAGINHPHCKTPD